MKRRDFFKSLIAITVTPAAIATASSPEPKPTDTLLHDIPLASPKRPHHPGLRITARNGGVFVDWGPDTLAYYQVMAKRSGDSPWKFIGTFKTSVFIGDVKPGLYDFRVRGQSMFGNVSSWVTQERVGVYHGIVGI